MFNKIILIGNLTSDPELKYLQGGLAVVNVGLAVNRPYKKDTVDFFRLQAWGKVAETVANHLKIGALVQVEGAMHSREYEKNNEIIKIWEVDVNNITFLKEGK